MSTLTNSFDDSVTHTMTTGPSFEDDDSYNNPQQFNSFEVNPMGSDGPIQPRPAEMGRRRGLLLESGEGHPYNYESMMCYDGVLMVRENEFRLEGKEKKEKEQLIQIIERADEYKIEFYRKREAAYESNKVTNREREKLLVANLAKFHAEADRDYWKAIADFIPSEVPAIEMKGKKDQEKKPPIAVTQGPKPGKPTEVSGMRQMLIKLKHNTPPHLKPSPTLTPAPADDAKTSDASVASTSLKEAGLVTTPEAVVYG